MTSSGPPPPIDSTEELRELAEKVSAQRRDLETVEARLRQLAGLGFETVDVPTVLTTNHAVRRAARQGVLMVAAAAALVLLGVGIGAALRRSPPPAAAVFVASPPSATTQAEPVTPAASSAPPDVPPMVASAPTPPGIANATAEARRRGFVTIVTYPSARVIEGDRILGTTPLYKTPLDAGDHALLLDAGGGLKKTVYVKVVPGETASLHYTLAERVDRGF